MANHPSAFSPSLMLAGMDYIAPSAVCIKPTMVRAKAARAADDNDDNRDSVHGGVGRHARATRRDDDGGGDAAATMMADADAAMRPMTGDVLKITLQDCLACSGCVTTAETILVQAQSRSELTRARAADAQRPWLVTISEQSASALAAHMHVSVLEAYATVAGFVRTVLRGGSDDSSNNNNNNATTTPVMYVADLRWASRLSAQKTAEEYARRHRHRDDAAAPPLPLLVSACPGWVCYCEKQGAALLPYLCPVLSPQGLAGSLAKRGVCASLYHMSVQPCFDRKLEAARDGYMPDDTDKHNNNDNDNDNGDATRRPYTDCVISTAELLEWMTEVDATLPWRGTLNSRVCDAHDTAAAATTTTDADTAAATTSAAETVALWEGSGGYHRRVMRHMLASTTASAAATAADGVGNDGEDKDDDDDAVMRVDVSDAQYAVQRNRNHQLITCARLPGQTFCIAYGFQQIQNVVRGLKKRLPAMRRYSFVEMMACPGGCLNGGGQLRSAVASSSSSTSSTLEATRERFAAYLTSEAKAHTHCCSKADNDNNNNDDDDSDKTPLFTYARMSALADALGPSSWTCTFTDRQKAFEQMLDEGNVHSLRCHPSLCIVVMPRVYSKPLMLYEQLFGYRRTYNTGPSRHALSQSLALPHEDAAVFAQTTSTRPTDKGAETKSRIAAAFANDVRRLQLLATQHIPGGYAGDEYDENDDDAVDADDDFVRVCKLYALTTDDDDNDDGYSAGAMSGSSGDYNASAVHASDDDDDDDAAAAVQDAEAAARDVEAQAADLAAYRTHIRHKLRERAMAAQLNQPGYLYVGRTPATLRPYGIMLRAFVVNEQTTNNTTTTTTAAAAAGAGAAAAASDDVRDEHGGAHVRIQWKASKRSSSLAAYPLHWAVLGRAHDAIRYLVDHGADVDCEVQLCPTAVAATTEQTQTTTTTTTPALTPARLAVDNASLATLRVLRTAAAKRDDAVRARTAALQRLESQLEQRKARRERRQLARDQRRAAREDAEAERAAHAAKTTDASDDDDDDDNYGDDQHAAR